MSTKEMIFFDSLYGAVKFGEDIKLLVDAPITQRLRHVRLSNIDSIDMPGIANLSRYEHSLGVCYLAGQVSLQNNITHEEKLTLTAAALLHDWAITSFGHLVEEALMYVGTGFDHEDKLYEIVAGEDPDEIGGANRQILEGRETGLVNWVSKVAKGSESRVLEAVTNYIRGNGRFGKLISGDIDLDNIDNVFRVAYHMGLVIDRECPVRLARSIVGIADQEQRPIFQRSAENDILLWLSTRRAVYEKLMLAQTDFTGKLMILSAAIQAFEAGEIDKTSWDMTDYDFLQRLRSSKQSEVKDTITRWLVGEVWHMAPLHWMSGSCPDFPKLKEFSEKLSSILSRTCFAYGIKDKRERALNIQFDDGKLEMFGEDAHQWLFGVGSSKRKSFSKDETNRILNFSKEFFGASVISIAENQSFGDAQGSNQFCLL